MKEFDNKWYLRFKEQISGEVSLRVILIQTYFEENEKLRTPWRTARIGDLVYCARCCKQVDLRTAVSLSKGNSFCSECEGEEQRWKRRKKKKKTRITFRITGQVKERKKRRQKKKKKKKRQQKKTNTRRRCHCIIN